MTNTRETGYIQLQDRRSDDRLAIELGPFAESKFLSILSRLRDTANTDNTRKGKTT